MRVSIGEQLSEVERRQAELLAEENGDGMAEDLAQPTRREMPGISGPEATLSSLRRTCYGLR